MKKVLILGGTRFFGKKLVNLLLKKGHDVTIVTRGIAGNPFDDQVNHVVADREDSETLYKAVGGQYWDLVYDNICFSPDDAAEACRIFANKARHYIFTSTLSVYGVGIEPSREEDFDPYTYPITSGGRYDFEYGEGKRLAEAVFFQKAQFPVSAIRFPIVLGPDDYTKRLHFHIHHVQSGKTLGIPNIEACLSFIHSDEGASFLYWIGESKVEGPINACSDGQYSLGKIISMIEQKTGCQAKVMEQTTSENMSPFGVPDSWYMVTNKANKAGYTFMHLNDWFPELVVELVEEFKK